MASEPWCSKVGFQTVAMIIGAMMTVGLSSTARPAPDPNRQGNFWREDGRIVTDERHTESH